MKKEIENSSTVRSIEYNEETMVFTVVFTFGSYTYHPVPKDVADKAFSADSVGTFIHSDLKNKYITTKL